MGRANKIVFGGVYRLRGIAKLWYDELPNPPTNRDSVSHQIYKQFPGETSFGKLFDGAAQFKSTPGDDLQTYCFAKLGKIIRLKLDISEDKLVDFIAYGIHDASIRTTILAMLVSRPSRN